MTGTISEHPYRQIMGMAFVSLAPVEVSIHDDKWDAVMGQRGMINGGVELDVDDELLEIIVDEIEACGDDHVEASKVAPELYDGPARDLLVPLTVNDPYWPEMRVLVPLVVLKEKFNMMDVGEGPRTGLKPKGCPHDDRDYLPHDCCFRLWWRKKAIEKGIRT